MSKPNPTPKQDLTADIYYWATVHSAADRMVNQLTNSLASHREALERADLAVMVARWNIETTVVFDNVFDNLHLEQTPLDVVTEARRALDSLDSALGQQRYLRQGQARMVKELETQHGIRDEAWGKFSAACRKLQEG